MNLHILESRLFGWVVVSISSVYVFVRSIPTLPTVMQDEYIYLSQALLIGPSENQFGNFLHAIVYSGVLAFGDDFYIGVKLINTLFLTLFGAFVFLTARRFVDVKLAILLGTGSVFSATGLYASIFSPEIMFFALASASVFFLSVASESRAKRPLVFTGISLAFLTLAGLTKPHAIILSFGFVLFFAIAFFLKRMGKLHAFYSVVIFLFGYPALKLILGFLIAGTSGLTLLGNNYDSSLRDFISRLAEFSQGALSAAGGAVSSTYGVGFASFSSFVFLQLFVLAVALLFMTFGLPLLLIRPVSELNNFQLLVITVTFVYLIAVAGFSGLVTFAGDDHSNRVLARYFEFLVPFIFISVLAEVSNRRNLPMHRLVLTVFGFVGVSAVWLFILGDKQLLLADSSILLGSFREPLLPWVVILLGLTLIILVKVRPKLLLTWTTLLVVGTSTIIGFSSLQRQIDLNSAKAPADYAGIEIRNNFPATKGEEILIVGTNRQLAFVTKFWSLKSDVNHLVTGPGTTMSINSNLFENYTLVVQLPNVLITDGITLREGNGFRILGKNSVG